MLTDKQQAATLKCLAICKALQLSVKWELAPEILEEINKAIGEFEEN